MVHVSPDDVTEIPLGFQPLGISAYGDMVLITDYFAPAVCMNKVTVKGSNLFFEVAWIHGALNSEGVRCRGGFPDMAYPSGANRCVTAFLAPWSRSVCVGRIDREFFLLTPEDDAKWRIKGRIPLPEDLSFPLVHSAVAISGLLHTVESDASMDHWRTVSYEWEGDSDLAAGLPQLRLLEMMEIPRFHYGVGHLSGGELVTVASSHSVHGPSRTDPLERTLESMYPARSPYPASSAAASAFSQTAGRS